MTAPAAYTGPHPIRSHRTLAELADTFRAWKTGTAATPLAIHAGDLAEAVQSAAVHCCHGEHYIVEHTEARTGKRTVHAYAIKREAKRSLRRNPETGAPEWSQRLYPVHLFSLPVTDFAPVEHWHWSPGCDVVGHDGVISA